MKFKIGDKVKFLNDTGGGKVSRVGTDGYIYVMTDDGFEIPVSSGELILDTLEKISDDSQEYVKDTKEYLKNISSDNPKQRIPSSVNETNYANKKIPINLPEGTQLNILIGFVPENINAVYKAKINCYLINDSEYYLYFMLGTQEQGNYHYLSSGEIEPDTKLLIDEFDQTALAKINKFHIQALVVSEGYYHPVSPVNEEIDITQYDFLKNHIYKQNDYFDDNALIINCLTSISKKNNNDLMISVDKNKRVMPEATVNKAIQRDTLEIDLHIEALCNDYSQLSNTEILRIQMNHFRKSLEEAISKKVRRIVFIHGVGNGTLKLELRNELKRNYPELIFQDASFKEYGFGATLVYLNVNK
jgi:hypothetical protein